MGEKYTDQELEDVLRRAFVDKGFKSVLYDGYVATQKPFVAAAIQHGLDKDLLCEGSPIEEEQYTAQIFILTEEGKGYFGLS